MREDRGFFREEIMTVVAGFVSCANDRDDDEDEEEEDEKKGEDDDEDEEEEEEPLWSTPSVRAGDGRSSYDLIEDECALGA